MSVVYIPEDPTIQVHQSRVCACPIDIPAGHFWYGEERKGPGRPPNGLVESSFWTYSGRMYLKGTKSCNRLMCVSCDLVGCVIGVM